jgi:hypothetical protein
MSASLGNPETFAGREGVCDDEKAVEGTAMSMRAHVALLSLLVVPGCSGGNSKVDAPTVVDGPPDAPPDAATYDTCAGARELTFVTGLATGTADTNGAGDDATASCGGAGSPDVVFKFTTPTVSTLLINVKPTAGNPRAVISLRSDCATMLTEFGGCAVAATGGGGVLEVVRGVAAGTHYLWIDSADGQGGTFDVSIQVTANAGDSCAGQIPLSFTGGEVNISASTFGSTNDESATCGGSTGLDNVYRIDLTATSNVEISATTKTPAMSPLIYLNQTSCVGGDLGCAAAPMAGAGTSLRFGSLPVGTYFLWVDAVDSMPGLYNITAKISTPGVGDTCAAPAALTFTNGMASVTGNSATLFHDSAGTCAGGTSPDAVYTFTTTATQNLRVDVTTTTSTYQPVVYLRSASCTGTQLACGIAPTAGGTGSIAYGSLPPGTYYLWVDGANNTSGAYTMTAVLGNPSPGDTCALAAPLTFTNGMAMVSGDTSTWFHDLTGTCATGLAPDGVYTFTTTTIQDLRLSLSTTTSTYQPAIYVRSASCTGTQIGCGSAIAAGGTATLDIAALPVGTYYVWIDGVGSTSGLFSLMATLSDPLPGDHCTNPASLVFTSGTATATGTTAGNFHDGNGSCATGTAPDVVYTFTTSTIQDFRVNVGTTTSTYQPVVYLRSASCAAGSQVGCGIAATLGGTASLDLPALPVGTYYLWIDGVNATSGAFSINATLTDPVAGDHCTNTAPLTFTAGSATASGTTVGTYNDGNGTCATGTAPDVIYSFTTSSIQDFRVTVSTSTSTYQPSIYLRSASCTTGTQLGCANAAALGGNASLDIGALPVGTYYLWIDGVSGTAGAYSINATLTNPLPGDHCTNTAPLTFSGGTAIASGTTAGTYSDGNGTCATGTAPDVIYSFTTSSVQEFQVTVSTSTGTYQPAVFLRSASCTTGTQVGCAFASALGGSASLNIGALPAGTYYLWIDGVGGTSGAYSINATLTNPVAGERCANPEPLVFTSGMAMVTGNTTNMYDDAAGTCGGSGGPDKVYSFTTTQNLQLTANISTTTATYRPVIYVRSASCTGTQVTGACNAAATMGGTATLPPTVLPAGTYYLWVDSMTTGGAFTLTANLGALPPAAVRPVPPTDVAVPGPMAVTFEVVDAFGGVVTSNNSVRFTVTANGSATFPNASQGSIVSGMGTNTVLVQVASGRITLNANDTVAETVTYTATDTQSNGLSYPSGSGTATQMSSTQTVATNPATNTFNLNFIERPSGNGTLTITAFGDFDFSSETISIFMESLAGTSYGNVFGNGNQCTATITQSVTIPLSDLTTHLLDGTATIVTRADPEVNFCTGTMSVRLSFPTTNSARFL